MNGTSSQKKSGKKRFLPLFAWFLVAILLVFFAINRHSRADRFNYHSELYSDKAGYSIYLQALQYGFDGRNIPDTGIVFKTGNGFSIDSETGVILTKYTYGTALAQLPLYLIGSLLEPSTEAIPGFSVIQNRMISVSASLYLLLGLIFLYRFLRYYHEKGVVILTLGVLIFGTNLLYYGSMETGMSHVYSFAVFSGFLLFIKRWNFFEHERFWELFVFGCLTGWILVLRQSNLLFPLVFFFLDAGSFEGIRIRLKRMFKPKNLLSVLFGVLLLLVPQLLYWNYAFESALAYSYGEEGFNWINPRILKVLFDPYNGLFLYAPVLILVVGYMVVMIKRKVPNAWLIAATLAIMTYIFSCWWAWWFGCAFGGRSYVEYLSLFSLALAYGWQDILRKSRPIIVGTSLLVVLCCGYTTKMAFSLDGCFPGSKNWDWPVYWNEVTRKVK